MRNLPAWEPQTERLDRTRRKIAYGDARGTYRAASPVEARGRGTGDINIIDGKSGVAIEKVVLRAGAQTVTSGGAVSWDTIEGVPQAQRGFVTLTLDGTVEINVDGVLTLAATWLWDSYTGVADSPWVLTRDGTDIPVGDVETPPIDTNYHLLFDQAVDVKAGDTLKFRPQSSGSGQDLTWAVLQLQILVLASATSDVAQTLESPIDPYEWYEFDATATYTYAGTDATGTGDTINDTANNSLKLDSSGWTVVSGLVGGSSGALQLTDQKVWPGRDVFSFAFNRTEYAFEMFFKTSDVSAVLLGAHYNTWPELAVNSSGALEWANDNAQPAITGPVVNDGTVHHVVVRHQSGTDEMLVDGVSYGTAASSDGAWYRGFDSYAGTAGKTVTIDELVGYRYYMSDSYVQSRAGAL